MIELPAALAPWAQQLAALPSDVVLTLAPWIGRLSLAVGPLATRQRHHAGDPDGYGGLSRRGSYERLVTTEWGVAELFPDEFLRRAAAGEHLFLELARREPHGALRSIAIVSAGPAQLGAPRLAHVASLIVLARRASAAGASFCWGVLEDSEHRLNDGLDEEGIQRLLGARTARAADPDALDRWREAIGGDDTHDFWFIGGDEDAAVAARAGASRIVVRDLLVPDTRALEVEIDRRGPPTRLRLDLPPQVQCARLLRDPFESGGAPKVATAKTSAVDVHFAPGARRLIVRLADGSFEAWPIPSSPRDKLGNPRRWEPPPNQAVVAIGVGRRSVLAATAHPDHPEALELHYGSNHRVRVSVPARLATELTRWFARKDTLPLGGCALVHLREHARTDLILEVCGQLLVVAGFRLWPDPGTTLTAVAYAGGDGAKAAVSLATAFFHTRFVWAERHDTGRIDIFEAGSSGNQPVATLAAPGERDVRFGFSMPQGPTWGCVVAASPGQKPVVVAPSLTPTTIDVGAPVLGVCSRDGTPWLLTRPQPNRLAWLGGDHRELLPAAGAPITTVAVCPSQPNLAWLTEAGEVVVYSMQHKSVLFRRLPTGAQ